MILRIAHFGVHAVADDPLLWLEGITDDQALDWVRAENAKTQLAFTTTCEFAKLRDDLRLILDSEARIPEVIKRGDYYYNFWKDKNNPAGLWRRTTLAEYKKQQPAWDVLIDLDALNKSENANWVWHGAICLKPDYRHCLIALSRGGSDADETREFDLHSKQWVADGFFRPEAKGGMCWKNANEVFIYTDFGVDSMTSSGYPKIAKLWQRGTPLEQAKVVYEGTKDDMYIAAFHDDSIGFERDFVSRTIEFYNDELYVLDADGSLTKIEAPNSAQKAVHKQYLLLELRESLVIDGHQFTAGSLLVTNFDQYMQGKRDFTVLFAPTDTTSLAGYTWTKNFLLLNVLDDVKNKISGLDPSKNWQSQPLIGAPSMGTLSITALDDEHSDDYFLTTTDYLTPTALMMGSMTKEPELLKQLPCFFDASLHDVSQHFVVSRDGERVPYFRIAPKDMALNAENPTLLYGYGGFEISLTPNYSASVGRAWLRDGGVFVVANIRGGGEYGPRWHQAALKENRHRAFEDFAAVAKDLIAKRVTSPKHLGIQGGSNGGLLMGNMLVMYPELFGAVVCQVPLLDMKRYHKLLAGASWMAEYGDPDSDDWTYIQTFSPYQQVKNDASYPPVLFTTSTRDDRVHPGHARKMMALMKEQGHAVWYYENIEGGHGGAANNEQVAFVQALTYT
ncbi:MAG: S9 family peptidase, partial [Arenimonas sp.]|nr:S9 family peptidase [Arenimonas sp.]